MIWTSGHQQWGIGAERMAQVVPSFTTDCSGSGGGTTTVEGTSNGYGLAVVMLSKFENYHSNSNLVEKSNENFKSVLAFSIFKFQKTRARSVLETGQNSSAANLTVASIEGKDIETSNNRS